MLYLRLYRGLGPHYSPNVCTPPSPRKVSCGSRILLQGGGGKPELEYVIGP